MAKHAITMRLEEIVLNNLNYLNYLMQAKSTAQNCYAMEAASSAAKSKARGLGCSAARKQALVFTFL